MKAPDLQSILAQIQAGHAGGQPTPPASPHAGLQASLQAELNQRLMAAQRQFERDIQTAIAETNEIQNSDLLTLRIGIGEEAMFRRTEAGSIEELVNWLVEHGWAPLGTPTSTQSAAALSGTLP